MLTTEQVEARKVALTSSDAWDIIDPTKWPELKAFILAGRPYKDSIHMQRGRDQEPFICAAAAALTGWQLHESETVYHPTTPYLLCHPDRIILTDTPGILEAKCPGNEFMMHKSRDRYHCQLQWHLMCSGYTWGALAIGYGNWESKNLELRVIPVERNQTVIGMMLQMAQSFWTYLKEDV